MKIRYKLIRRQVNNLFITLNLNSYPVDILKIYSYFHNCKVVSYSKHKNNYNLTEKEIIEHFGSEEGCSFYQKTKKRYLIFYNDLESCYKCPERRTWTLAHELGHMVLNHHTLTNKTVLFRNSLTDEEYKWLEAEANRFASLLLANPIILDKLNISNNKDIMRICSLSEPASIYRFEELKKWQNNKFINKQDFQIIKQFNEFLQYKTCTNCGFCTSTPSSVHCPICGKRLKGGKSDMIYTDGYELDDKGRALKCPVCDNEQMATDGVYCKICGTYLVNKCTNEGLNYSEIRCGLIAKGNARFCEYCGAPTTFYVNNLLHDWKTDNTFEEIENAKQEAAASLSNDEIPF